jgi:hypothetical protein
VYFFLVKPSSTPPKGPNRIAETSGEAEANGASDGQERRIAFPDRGFVESNLKTARPECDRPESPDDDADVRIGRGLKHPKDKGYAKFLATLGYDPNWAGMLAAMIVEEGRIRAATSAKRTEFSRALRRLANPRLEREAFIADSRLVHEDMDGADLTSGLFQDLPPSEGLAFIGELRFCVAGNLAGRAEVARIAKAVWRRVAVSRGPKLTQASAAHEYFLESQSIFNPAAFTWSPDGEDFTDRLTRATREEFDDPDFNPVPARRRLKAKQR